MSFAFSDNEVINSAMKNYLNRKLKTYGDIKYAYLIMNKKKPTDIIIISNYPSEWVDTYKMNNYQHIDPVILTALKIASPFSWGENIVINSKLSNSKFFNLSKKYNIINGYTFVLHDQNNNLVTLSIMIGENESNDIEMIENNKDKIQMLLIYAHEKFTTFYLEMVQNKNINSENEKELFSQRENDILYWASMGKTYQEIALILGITTSTVKFHIGNVVKKLGVLNAKHAIRLGVELQLIKPVPL